MTGLSNFHTHTFYCDGKNSPEEMVREALRLGAGALGFSGHSFTPFDPGYCMDEGRELAYRREVLRMRQGYGDQIRIYLGIEQDYFSPSPWEGYNYRIGSVHYVKKGDCYLSVDDTPELLRQGVDRLYGGDWYALIADYYRLVADLPRKTRCQIIGHFDLITKFNEKHRFFDEEDPRYRGPAQQALSGLLEQGALLEINTGAMSRGHRTLPYPAPFLLDAMGKAGASALFSSDAHRKEDLLFGRETVISLCHDRGIPLLNP